jgi:hypothetical protein
MKNPEMLCAFILAAAALTACNTEGLRPDAAKTITIDATIAQTKVVVNGNDAVFELGDQISLYAWVNDPGTGQPAERVVDGVVNTLNEVGGWRPESTMNWLDMVTPHYFVGIYPVRTVADLTAGDYTLDPADQAASDLLIAANVKGIKASDEPVRLSFGHAMAKLYVNLKFRNQWDGTPTVGSVVASAAKTATINFETQAVTPGAAATVALPAQKTAAKGFACSYASLMVPQTSFRTLTITIDGQEYVFTHTADIPLASGKTTTVNLTAGRDKIELASDISLQGWIDDTPLNGEAQDE